MIKIWKSLISSLIVFTVPFSRLNFDDVNKNCKNCENPSKTNYVWINYLINKKKFILDIDYLYLKKIINKGKYLNKDKYLDEDIFGFILGRFHFVDIESYSKGFDYINNLYLNQIFPETYNVLVKTFFLSIKNDNILYFFKKFLEFSDHCFPYQRRVLLDVYHSLYSNGELNFESVFKDDKNFSDVVIQKFKFLKDDNQNISYQEIIKKITDDFLESIISLKNEKFYNRGGWNGNYIFLDDDKNIQLNIMIFDRNIKINEQNIDITFKILENTKFENTEKENNFKKWIEVIIASYLFPEENLEKLVNELKYINLEKLINSLTEKEEGFQNLNMIKIYISNQKKINKNLSNEDIKNNIYKTFKVARNTIKDKQIDDILKKLDEEEVNIK